MLESPPMHAQPVMLGPVPVDFILFAAVLAGIAFFQHQTFRVAVTGLMVITLYKILFTGFNYGLGVAGFVGLLGHEWVILANLFFLLMGFALLSKHFEDSNVPIELPKILPDDWKGGFLLLVMVFVFSSFLDNIAAALIGGTMAAAVFRNKVHIGYLAAIVAASNGGGAGSVVGDTTTTMMWIAGVDPLDVLEGFIASGMALVIFGILAARQQQAYSPIMKDPPKGVRVDYVRVGIVAFILVVAIVANVTANVKFPGGARPLPRDRGGGVGRHPGERAAAPPRLVAAEAYVQGHDLPAFAGAVRLDDAGGEASGRIVADRARAGVPLGGVRQHPAHRAGAPPGRLRLGLPRLRRGLRRLDDLVRLLGRASPFPTPSPRRSPWASGCATAGTWRWPTWSDSSCCSPPTAGSRTRNIRGKRRRRHAPRRADRAGYCPLVTGMQNRGRRARGNTPRTLLPLPVAQTRMRRLAASRVPPPKASPSARTPTP